MYTDRHGRAQGKAAGVLPVVDQDMHKPSALPTPDSYVYFAGWEKRCGWKNEVTIKSYVDMLPRNLKVRH